MIRRPYAKFLALHLLSEDLKELYDPIKLLVDVRKNLVMEDFMQMDLTSRDFLEDVRRKNIGRQGKKEREMAILLDRYT